MPFDDLTKEDRALIGRCLRAAADGPFFKNNRAFHCIFGVNPEEVREIAEKWPNVDITQEEVHCAITNSMNNLLGYPYKATRDDWDAWITATPEMIMETLSRWLGREWTSYFDALA